MKKLRILLLLILTSSLLYGCSTSQSSLNKATGTAKTNIAAVSASDKAAYTEWNFLGNLDSYNVHGNNITFSCGNQKVMLVFCAHDIVRVRMAPEGTFEKDNLWLDYNGPYCLVRYDWPKTNFGVSETKEYVKISTDCLIVKVQKSPFRLTFLDKKNNLLCSEYNGMGWKDKNVICSMQTDVSDHFYGLGARAGSSIDRKGEDVAISISHTDTCNDWLTPFFMNPKGYGIFNDTIEDNRFNFSLSSSYYFSASSASKYKNGELDYYFMYGPDMKHILGLYTDITGKSPILPARAYWPWAWRPEESNVTPESVLSRAKEFRDRNIPSSIINVEPGWLNTYCDFKFNSSFTDPKSFISQLEAMYFDLSLWQVPYMVIDGEMYNTASTKKYILKDFAGYPYQTKWWLPGAVSIIDYSKKNAESWYFDQKKPLIDMGVRTFKVDSPTGQQGGLSNGLPSNNLFDLLAAKSEYENMESYTGERPCMMMRSGYAGSQRYPLVWSSDQYNADDNDLMYQMMAQQNIGLSGNAFWANDIGTWQGAKMTPERYARWAEFGLMAGVVPSLCSSRYTPWYFGPEVENIFRKYDLLRSRMLPYIYTYAKEASETGVPIVRSMILECQDNKDVYNMWDEWFFGSELLVAPITNDRDSSRDVYLPEGKWIDWWNGMEYAGPQTVKAYDAPLDKMPIFIRAGAIIPMGPEKQYFDGAVTNPLTLRIYPSGKSSFTLYEDNGVDLKYRSGEFARSKIECSESSGMINIRISKPDGSFIIPDRDIYLEVSMPKKPSIAASEKINLVECQTIEGLESAEKGWYFENGLSGFPGTCHVKLKYTGNNIDVSLRR